MDKLLDTATPEEVKTEEETFKAVLFFLREDESRYGQLFEDLIKADFVGRDEYPKTINGAYEVLLRTSRQFGGIILRGRRSNFTNERRHGGRKSGMFTQTKGRYKRGECESTPRRNSSQVDPVPDKHGQLYSHTECYECHRCINFADNFNINNQNQLILRLLELC